MFGPIDCEPTQDDILLTHHIYEPDQFDSLVPLGRMWDSHVTPTDHLYLRMNHERSRGMVHTPAAGRLIFIERFSNDQSPHWDNSLVEPDFRLVIAHSCDLFSIYIHLGELAPEIAAAVGDLPRGGRWPSTEARVSVQLDAGDPIAKFGGSSIDYSLHDGTVILPGLLVPEHYSGEPWKIHTVDPFDYMTDELFAELLAKNERQVEPYGGKIDYDVPGTLAGNWFMDGTVDYGGGGFAQPNYWNGHLAIAYDHIDPSQLRISIGRDVGIIYDDCYICRGVYGVNGNAPDPASVTAADGLVRYELTGRLYASEHSTERTIGSGVVIGTFLALVLDDMSIKTEFLKGKAASDVVAFTDDAVVYRR